MIPLLQLVKSLLDDIVRKKRIVFDDTNFLSLIFDLINDYTRYMISIVLEPFC